MYVRYYYMVAQKFCRFLFQQSGCEETGGYILIMILFLNNYLIFN